MVQATSPARSWTRIALAIAALAALTFALAVSVRPAYAGGGATLHESHVGTDSSQTADGEDCGDATVPDGQVLWHFVLNGLPDGHDSPIAGHFTFTGAGTLDVDSNKSLKTVEHWDVYTTGDDVLEGATADWNGDYNQFNLSHICHGAPGGGSQPESGSQPEGGSEPDDGAMSPIGGGNAVPTIIFGAILLGALGTLAYANVTAVRSRR